MEGLKDIILNTNSWGDLVDRLWREACTLGIKILICIAIYYIGRKLIRYLDKIIDKMLRNKEFDSSVVSFLRSLVNIILTAALLIAVVNVLGIKSSSFIALFASIGVAMGMALSGTLQNFAGGVMILFFRPYRVGDYIEAQGQGGTVKEIQIFNTIIITADNRTVYIPNGGLSSNVIVNYNHQTNRRLEWVIGVSYGTDFNFVKSVLNELIIAEKRILDHPAPEIVIKTLNESSIDIQIRAWTKRADFWGVYSQMNELIYQSFTEKGIDIPFRQLTVHLKNQ